MNTIKSCLVVLLITSCVNAVDNKRSDDAKGPRTPTDPNPLPATADTTKAYRSQFYKNDNDVKPLSYYEMITAYIKNPDEVKYALIPDASFHDGDVAGTTALKNLKDCGFSEVLENLKQRRTSCTNINPNTSFWNGEIKGISGEGKWALIYKYEDIVIWEDQTTSLLWTSTIDTGNWDEAVGSKGQETKICDLVGVIPAEHVKWSLPTRNLFLQADVNGVRFVLPQDESHYWTATSIMQSPDAWAIKQNTGVLTEYDKEKNNLNVRCVGIPLK